ncbi:MAG: NUDIX hydrolase [Phycisphaerae bacterium]|nr:NUDIX hydrolase [Phycisphaerae bacterium]
MTKDRHAEKKVLAEGKYFRMILQGRWEYLEPKNFSDVVMIVPVTDDGKLVIIEQYRVPVAAQTFEIPAGLVGDDDDKQGESVYAAAHRELLEETGYQADSMEVILEGAPSAGSNSLILTFLMATGLKKVTAGGGDEHEDIIVHEVPLDEVPAWLDEKRTHGNVVDLKIYTGLFLAQKFHQPSC